MQHDDKPIVPVATFYPGELFTNNYFLKIKSYLQAGSNTSWSLLPEVQFLHILYVFVIICRKQSYHKHID